MTRKPFIEGTIEGDDLRVGARDGDYCGPIARISFDSDWLYINTDDYEGNAMLNIETLPMLRRALSRLARHLKHKPPAIIPPTGPVSD